VGPHIQAVEAQAIHPSGSNFPQDGRAKFSCWACGEKGDKRGDPLCRKGNDGTKGGSPSLAKRKLEGEQSNNERSGLDRMCLYANYAAFISDYMLEKSRNNESPYYLRTGKLVDLNLIKVKCFGPPGIYSPTDRPIDKRAPVGEEGWFAEKQGPVMINNGTLPESNRANRVGSEDQNGNDGERYLPQRINPERYSSAPTSERERRIGTKKISSGQTSHE
jgi:hypothetical protein